MLKDDYMHLKQLMARNKVFDAWQYVKNIQSTLNYMELSYNLLVCAYKNQISSINELIQNKMQLNAKNGIPQFNFSLGTDSELMNMDIAGVEIPRVVFLRKTIIEFFHYGRISLDGLFQVVNASLFGEDALLVEKVNACKLIKKLNDRTELNSVRELMKQVNNNSIYKYLRHFDDYVKHIELVPLSINSSLLVINESEFLIEKFVYQNETHEEVDALKKVEETRQFVYDVVAKAYSAIHDILNCFSEYIPNSHRIHDIRCECITMGKGMEQEKSPYTFIIDLSLDELSAIIGPPPEGCASHSSKIYFHPVRITNNGDVCTADDTIEELFISNQDSKKLDIIGIARLDTNSINRFYRVYDVQSCSMKTYIEYINSFKGSNSQQLSDNLLAILHVFPNLMGFRYI